MELSTEQMNSMKALAQTNLKVSEAKNILLKLQETETQYLIDREKRVTEKIQSMFNDSKEIIDQTKKNYEETNGLLETVSSLSEYLSKAYRDFSELVVYFEEQNSLWQSKIIQQEIIFDQIKQQIKSDQIRIINDRKGIEQHKISLANDQRRIDDQRETLKRAINRLKENKHV